jgi:uncharacterized protein DUF1996
MRRSMIAVTSIVAAALVAIAACGPPPMGGHPRPPVGPSGGSASSGPGGPADAGSGGGGGVTTFRVLCGSSHVLADDPIVHPNMPGMSHVHQFFGNQTTNAASTAQSLLGQGTTCSAAADASGYWVPMLYQNGVPVPASAALIYYRGGSHADPSQIQPFPAGLRMIAGDAAATGPFPLDAVAWMCQGMSTLSPAPLDCGGGTTVLQIRFPDCWDGVHLDSADHKSHMAYTVSGVCPSNYPVPVPLLELNVRYQTNGNAGISLASGAPYTYHADFFNAWNQASLAGFINQCLHTGQVCGTVS